MSEKELYPLAPEVECPPELAAVIESGLIPKLGLEQSTPQSPLATEIVVRVEENGFFIG